MKVAVVGSRGLKIEDFGAYLPKECDEIVSGGAAGVDSCAAAYARAAGTALTEFLPEYEKYGRAAPIVRNKSIVEYSDEVIAFWDGISKGTKWVINYCSKIGKPCRVITCIPKINKKGAESLTQPLLKKADVRLF